MGNHKTYLYDMARIGVLVLTATLWLASGNSSSAQYKSYSDYYRKSGQAMYRNDFSMERYMHDKYLYRRPTVSPYLSGAMLGDTESSTAYYTYIRPELERRRVAAQNQASYIQQRKLQGNIGYTAHPGAGFYGATAADAYRKPVQSGRTTPSFYHNKWYGGWNNR